MSEPDGRVRRWRVPPSWREQGTDPDYRFTLANERTFLAWSRTALALLAAALAVLQLVTVVGRPLRIALAVVLVLGSAGLAVTAFLEWRQREYRLRLELPFAQPWMPRTVAIGLIVLVVLVAVAVASAALS
jgi:putative membrane protein